MRQRAPIFIATAILLLAQPPLPARSQDAQHQPATDTPRISIPPPSITGGKIITPTLDVSKPNAYIKLSVEISAQGQYALSSFGLTSPSGEIYTVLGEILPPGTTSGTVAAGTSSSLNGGRISGPGGPTTTLNEPVGYLQPGTYTITSAGIEDYAGNTTSYDASQIAALFNGNTITIVNPNTPDYTPPKIVSAAILTRKVSRSAPLPYVAIRMNATDDYSGVASLEAFAITGAPGGGVEPAATAAPPFTKGSLTTFMQVAPTLPTGTYLIDELYACDAAGNCLVDANPTDINAIFKGKTTFEIVD